MDFQWKMNTSTRGITAGTFRIHTTAVCQICEEWLILLIRMNHPKSSLRKVNGTPQWYPKRIYIKSLANDTIKINLCEGVLTLPGVCFENGGELQILLKSHVRREERGRTKRFCLMEKTQGLESPHRIQMTVLSRYGKAEERSISATWLKKT